MRKLLYLMAFLYSSIILAQNELPIAFGYEFRTSGPNMDHMFFLDKNVSTKVNLRGTYRRLDKVWKSPPPIFKIPIESNVLGLDVEYMCKLSHYQLSLSAGTIAFKAKSYSNGGDTKWFVSPTTFLSVQAKIYNKLYLGGRIGSLWFINTDLYQNFSGVRHEEFSLFLKYQIS